MMTKRGWSWRMLAIALACGLASCSDFSHHRFGGVRRSPDPEEGPPQPDAALAIGNAPTALPQKPKGNTVQQATFVPDRPAPMQPPAGDLDKVPNPLRVLYERAVQRHAQMDSYIFRLRRREVVGGRKLPEEVLQAKIRTQPYSVYLKWLSDEGKGREVVYVQGKFKNEMQVRLAPSDFGSSLFKTQSVAPDSPLVRSRSRYVITETGLGSMIAHFGRMVAGVEKNDPLQGTVKYLGLLQRPEFPEKVHAVHQIVPVGNEALLPKGGQRWWYFDAASGLPVMRITHDPSGEVEYYCHDHIQWPVRLDDDDFNPAKLWRK